MHSGQDKSDKSASPQRRTQAERTGEARTALIDAAVDLIAERGLGGVTLSDVGARAGYSRGLAVYHFGSKSGLILAVFDHVRSIGARAMANFAKLETTGSGRLLSLFDAIADSVEKSPALYRATTAMLIDGAMSPDPVIRQRAQDAEHEALNVVKVLMTKAEPRDGLDADALAGAMLSALYGVQVRAFMMGDAFDVRKELANLKAIGLSMLKTPC